MPCNAMVNWTKINTDRKVASKRLYNGYLNSFGGSSMARNDRNNRGNGDDEENFGDGRQGPGRGRNPYGLPPGFPMGFGGPFGMQMPMGMVIREVDHNQNQNNNNRDMDREWLYRLHADDVPVRVAFAANFLQQCTQKETKVLVRKGERTAEHETITGAELHELARLAPEEAAAQAAASQCLAAYFMGKLELNPWEKKDLEQAPLVPTTLVQCCFCKPMIEAGLPPAPGCPFCSGGGKMRAVCDGKNVQALPLDTTSAAAQREVIAVQGANDQNQPQNQPQNQQGAQPPVGPRRMPPPRAPRQ